MNKNNTLWHKNKMTPVLPEPQQAATPVHTAQTSNCALIASSKSMTVTLLQSKARTKIRNKQNYILTINEQLNNRLDLLW